MRFGLLELMDVRLPSQTYSGTILVAVNPYHQLTVYEMVRDVAKTVSLIYL